MSAWQLLHFSYVYDFVPTSQVTDRFIQGRAGLVALRRYRSGTNALGKAFYKGGFEKTMSRKEAALILETSYVPVITESQMRRRLIIDG